MNKTFTAEAKALLSHLVCQTKELLEKNQSAEPVFWVSTDLRVLLRATGTHPKVAGELAHALVTELLKAAGPKATILVSAFNFEFPRTKTFDADQSRVETGSFGQLLLKASSEGRILHPFYSFLSFGYHAQELANKVFEHSTGEGSIFEWIIDAGARLVTIGHFYNNSFSAIHHAEDLVGVPYRYRKTFAGTLVRGQQRIPTACSFLVRDLATCDGSALTRKGDEILRESGVVDMLQIKELLTPVLAYSLDLARVHQEVMKDLCQHSPVIVDYFGPQKPNQSVITREIADELYLRDLKNLSAV